MLAYLFGGLLLPAFLSAQSPDPALLTGKWTTRVEPDYQTMTFRTDGMIDITKGANDPTTVTWRVEGDWLELDYDVDNMERYKIQRLDTRGLVLEAQDGSAVPFNKILSADQIKEIPAKIVGKWQMDYQKVLPAKMADTNLPAMTLVLQANGKGTYGSGKAVLPIQWKLSPNADVISISFPKNPQEPTLAFGITLSDDPNTLFLTVATMVGFIEYQCQRL